MPLSVILLQAFSFKFSKCFPQPLETCKETHIFTGDFECLNKIQQNAMSYLLNQMSHGGARSCDTRVTGNGGPGGRGTVGGGGKSISSPPAKMTTTTQ